MIYFVIIDKNGLTNLTEKVVSSLVFKRESKLEVIEEFFYSFLIY